MSLFGPYLALVSYPLLAYLLGDPRVFKWGVEHGAYAPMAPEAEARALRNGRLIWIVRYAILTLYISLGLRSGAATFISSKPPVSRLLWELTGGVAAGLLLVLARSLASSQWPALGWGNPDHPILKGSTVIWLCIITAGGVAEELWRAFCLVGFRREGLARGLAVLLTSGTYALSELAGRPSRISGKKEEVYFTAAVGLFLGQLFISSQTLLVVVCANIAYQSLVFVMLRRENRPTQSANI